MASNDYYNTNNTYGDDGGDPDFTAAASRAQSEHSSTSPDLFSSAVSFLKENKDKFVGGGGDFSSGSSSGGPHVDEEEMVRAHQRMYGGGGGGGGGEGQGDGDGDTRSMGMGAAMQALKMFNSGGSSGGGGGHSSGSSNGGGAAGGPDLNSLIGLAMGQAGKLFDEKQGSGVSGDKQSAINHAAEAAMKMYLKSQMSGSSGSSGSGGPAQLLDLAGKFMSK